MKIARESVFAFANVDPGFRRFPIRIFFFVKHPKLKMSIVNKKVPHTADRPTAVFGSSVLHAPL
jgi:hypothetical protein